MRIRQPRDDSLVLQSQIGMTTHGSAAPVGRDHGNVGPYDSAAAHRFTGPGFGASHHMEGLCAVTPQRLKAGFIPSTNPTSCHAFAQYEHMKKYLE